MSKIEEINIKIKYSKIKNLEKICFYFSEDFTAIQTSKKLGISRQTINNYYKILRAKLNTKFLISDSFILNQLLRQDNLNIKYLNLYKQDIFYVSYKNKIFILDINNNLSQELNKLIQDFLKIPLSKHKKANCARVLLNQKKQSFIVSGYFKEKDDFKDYLEKRLKQFRGINKNKIFSYLKESQIRYNFSTQTIYQEILLSFK